MTKLLRVDALADGQGALLEIQTAEGPVELFFTYDDTEWLIDALQAAREKIQARRLRSAKPPLPEKAKAVERWETVIDVVNQDAVIRARYPDRTAQETRIPRSDIAAIAQFLDQARKRFEAGAEMRQ